MVKKTKNGPLIENERWKGVKVTSESLREVKKEQAIQWIKNYIILDEIKINCDEEAHLNLPYKFREYQPPDATEFERECEAQDTKS